jgi:hypothetical protein
MLSARGWGKSMRKLLSAIVAAGALALSAAAAQAATYDYTFSADNFQSQCCGGTPSPTSVSGSFSVNFDPSGGSFTNRTAGITFTTSDLTVDGTLAFSFDASSGKLTLGSLIGDGADAVKAGHNDFSFVIVDFLNNPSTLQFLYAQGAGTFVSYSPNVSVAATPIPATLPLMASALIALGGFGYFRARRESGALPAAGIA